MEDIDRSKSRIVTSAQNIGKVLYIGSGIAIVIVTIKLLTSQKSLQVSGVTIAIDKAWVLFAAISVVHVFLAIFAVNEIEAYINILPTARDLRAAFDQVASGENLFVHGLISRAVPKRPGSRVYQMHWSDPSTWVAYGGVIIFAVALLPWRLSTHGLRWASGISFWFVILLAVVLIAINWWAGSIWLIHLSQLDDLATWIESLPSGPVSSIERNRLIEISAPILESKSRPDSRSCYEIINMLNRFAKDAPSTGGKTNSKSFLNLKFRRNVRDDTDNLWTASIVPAEVDEIFVYFRSFAPWLIEIPSPWFLSTENQQTSSVQILNQKSLNSENSSSSRQMAESSPIGRLLGPLVELLIRFMKVSGGSWRR